MNKWVKQAFGWGRTKRILSIAAEANRYLLAQVLFTDDRPSIEKHAVVETSSGTNAAEALRQARRREHLSGDSIVLCLPQELAVMKSLRLPSVTPAEVREMAALQACRLMPLSPEEIIVDADVQEADNQGYSRAMVAVVRREDVAGILSTLREAGLTPDRVVLRAHGLAASVPHRSMASLVLEIGDNSSVLAVVQAGKIRLARSIPSSSTDRVMKEIRLSLASIQSDLAITPTTLVLSGESKNGLPEALKELDLPIEQLQAPSNGMRMDTFWTSVVGATLVAKEPGPTLLPMEDKNLSIRLKWKKELAVCGILFALLIGTTSLLLGHRFHSKEARLTTIERQLAEIEPEVRDLRQKLREVELVRGRADEQNSLAGILSALNRIVPAKISLTSINFEQDRHLTIQGTAFTLAEAVKVVEALEKSRIFPQVELRSSNTRPLEGREVVEFQIEARTKEKV